MMAAMPQWLNLRLDQLIMVVVLDARSLGLYVVAMAWSTAVHPLATVIAHGAVPALARAHDGHRKARLVYRAGAVVAIATSVVVLAATPVMLPLIFGAEFRSALPAALVLVIASGIASLNSVGAECLRGLGRPGSALRAECAGLAVTAIALPALIPLAGIVGAACASVLAYSATLIVQQRELSAPGENAILDVTAGVPPTLDPVA
jgi:O-antigen/teichoic acid export membrane protein